MAIQILSSYRYVGLSTDTKPTTNVPNGAMFTESDTSAVFIFDGNTLTWSEVSTDHVNIAPGNIHVAHNFEFPNASSRTGYSYSAGDLKKLIYQIDTQQFYALTGISPNTFVQVSGSGTGEPNTASNVGTGGVGPFKQKTGVDLEFRNIAAGSSKITVVLDSGNNEIEIDLDQDQIDGDTLVIDYAPSNYTQDTTPPEVTSSNELTAHLAGIDNAIATAGGETNTASNVGTGGIGWFKQKTGVDLEFKNIYNGSGISLVDNTGNSRIDISVKPDVTTGGDLAPVSVSINGVGLDVNDLNGDHLNIDYTPSGYTQDDSISEAINTNDLSAHLAGISDKLSELSVVNNGNKTPVRLATAAALPAYTPIGSGVGKKLQGNSNGQLSVDGINVNYAERILIKNETGASEIHNGIYDVTHPGDPTNPYELTRSLDYDESSEIIPSHLVQSSEGNTNADEIFMLVSDAPISIESTHLVYDTIKEGSTALVPVASSANIAVDSILLADHKSAKWLMEVHDPTANLTDVSEVIARERNLNTAFDQTTPVGDSLSYTLSFTSNGVSMSFYFQNNGSNTVNVKLRKLEI